MKKCTFTFNFVFLLKPDVDIGEDAAEDVSITLTEEYNKSLGSLNLICEEKYIYLSFLCFF